jgi:hypothetical protein
MSGDERQNRWALPPEDDWFAEVETSEAPVAPPEQPGRYEEESAPGRPGPPPAGRARVFALAIAAVLLIAGGVLAARWLAGDDDGGSATTGDITTLPDTAVTPPPPATITPPAPTPPPATTAPPTDIDLPPDGTYRRGDEGDSVLAIQQALAALGFYEGEVDGKFGAQTEEAVIAFQDSQDLTADGVVGPATLAALSQEIAGSG